MRVKLSILFIFLSWFVTIESFAEEDYTRIVILGRSNHEALDDSLKELDESIEIKNQRWFLKQVRSRGIKPKKLFQRPKDLTYIMEVTKTLLVITLSPTKNKLGVSIYDVSGTSVKEFDVKSKDSEISSKGVEKVREAISSMLYENEENEEEDQAEQKSLKEETLKKDPTKKESKTSIKEEMDSSQNPSSLNIRLSAGVIKRDLEVDSPNGALLTYNSSLYPAAKLDVNFYFGDTKERPGIYLHAMGGLDSVNYEVKGEKKSESLLHIDAELGGFYSIQNGKFEFQINGGARHSRFQIETPALPTTTYTTLNIGTKTFYSGFLPELTIMGSIQFIPLGLFHDGGNLFGESSFIYGVGVQNGVYYSFSDSMSFIAEYQMRTIRASFSGQGKSDFSDSHAFDFTQMLNLGIGIEF